MFPLALHFITKPSVDELLLIKVIPFSNSKVLTEKLPPITHPLSKLPETEDTVHFSIFLAHSALPSLLNFITNPYAILASLVILTLFPRSILVELDIPPTIYPPSSHSVAHDTSSLELPPKPLPHSMSPLELYLTINASQFPLFFNTSPLSNSILLDQESPITMYPPSLQLTIEYINSELLPPKLFTHSTLSSELYFIINISQEPLLVILILFSKLTCSEQNCPATTYPPSLD